MSSEKGKLIYKHKWEIFLYIGVIVVGLFFIILGIIFLLPIENSSTGAGILFIGLGIYEMIFLPLVVFTKLRVYEYGIQLPHRPIARLQHKKKIFIMFSEIIQVYMNESSKLSSVTKKWPKDHTVNDKELTKSSLAYIVLITVNKNIHIIRKEHIGDLKKLKEKIVGKVNIVTDKYWITGRGEVNI